MPKFLRFALLILAACAMAPVVAQATPIQYANFHLLNANQPFSLTNNGGTSITLSVADAPVVFNFTDQSGLPTVDHAAHLTLTSNAIPTPAISGFGMIAQPLGAASTLSIIEDGTGKNLLTLHFIGAILGLNGAPNANINATIDEVFGLSSDFGTLTTGENSLNLGLGTLSPVFSVGPGNFVNSFVANINGQFSGDFTANIPEPSSMVLAGLVAMGAVGFARRGSRRG